MGYTHHWECKNKKLCYISVSKRKQILQIVQKIVTRYQAILTGDGSGETRQPVVITPNMSEICLNGIEENAHETFFFPLNNELKGYEFCKTERKPYDVPVMEILIVLKHFIPALSVWSDGWGTKDSQFSEPGIAWGEAARRVRDLYGIATKLFYWDDNPEPGTEAKPVREKELVGAGVSQESFDPLESYRRYIRRS